MENYFNCTRTEALESLKNIFPNKIFLIEVFPNERIPEGYEIVGIYKPSSGSFSFSIYGKNS